MRRAPSIVGEDISKQYVLSSSEQYSGTLSDGIKSKGKTIIDNPQQIQERTIDDFQDKNDTCGEVRSTNPESSTRNTMTTQIPMRTNDVQYLTTLFADEVCESGIMNPSEEYFRALLSEKPVDALNTIAGVFYANYSTETKKTIILVGLLHMISHLKYDQVYPIGQLVALSAIGHKNKEVAEFGIKCYENWGHPEGIEKLKATSFSTPWLREYADQVIADLSEG